MNKKFIKENSDKFASDMKEVDVMKVVIYITKQKYDASTQRTMIQKFLLNWVTVGVVTRYSI